MRLGGNSTYAASWRNISVQGPEICFPKHASRDFTQHCLAQHRACCFLEISRARRTNPKPLSFSSCIVWSVLFSTSLFLFLFFPLFLRTIGCCGTHSEYDRRFWDAGLVLLDLFLSFYLNANTVNASDGVDEPAACAPHSESQHLLLFDLIFLWGDFKKDVTSNPPCAA